jgi:hypothetical protein
MSLPCITIPSVEVPHFDGNDVVSWKSPISSYLREMNPQVCWMVHIVISHTLEDCPQTQGQKKYIYLEVHASNALSSALSAEIKDEIEMEYGWFKRANLLWKVLEQMYGSSNSKRSCSSAPENISSPSTHCDQNQKEQSSVQKELNSVSLGKPDGLVSKPELLVEFRKLIRKYMKLQKRHGDLLCSHKELIDSYALLESAHKVMVRKVKDSKPHTCTCAPPSIDLSCANSCYSQAKSLCDEHVPVETCDNFIASENDELKRENEMLKMESS